MTVRAAGDGRDGHSGPRERAERPQLRRRRGTLRVPVARAHRAPRGAPALGDLLDRFVNLPASRRRGLRLRRLLRPGSAAAAARGGERVAGPPLGAAAGGMARVAAVPGDAGRRVPPPGALPEHGGRHVRGQGGAAGSCPPRVPGAAPPRGRGTSGGRGGGPQREPAPGHRHPCHALPGQLHPGPAAARQGAGRGHLGARQASWMPWHHCWWTSTGPACSGATAR